MIQHLNKRINLFTAIFLIFSIFFIVTPVSDASTEIYFQKEKKEIIAGNIFLVDLKISSEDSVNAIDGTITYDKDKLEIKSIKTDDTLFSLWVKEPTFDNKKGELIFVGGTSDGFNGKDKQIFEITFLAKNKGSATVGFKDIFSVFVNDGLGTRINPWLRPLPLSITSVNNNFKDYIAIFMAILIAILTIILVFIINKFFLKLKK